MSDLEKFLEERSKIPIPSGDVPRVKVLAKELALGFGRNLWPRQFHEANGVILSPDSLTTYFSTRWWGYDYGHLIEQLAAFEFVTTSGSFVTLKRLAVDLLEETEPYNIFISYRRLDSSALALLVLARLKEHSLVPFVDMALEAGGNWHADLEERISACDYFIILLGKDTLSSPMTVKEIQWALEYERTIIPLWHGRFDLQDAKWMDIEQVVKDAIQQTNAIRVTDESASGYNSAIVELLNRFGVTP